MAMLPLPKPELSEYAEYYRTYVVPMPLGDVRAHLLHQAHSTMQLVEPLGEERAGFRYAPDKWSIKQVLGHIVDAERLFAHRALAIARGDPADQPSMDQELWMRGADFDRRPLANLCTEYRAVRCATLALVESFDAEVGLRVGKASGNSFTVRSLIWTIAGHEMHHVRVLVSRYGVR